MTEEKKVVKHRRMKYTCVAKARVTTDDGHMNPGDEVMMLASEAKKYGDLLEKS